MRLFLFVIAMWSSAVYAQAVGGIGAQLMLDSAGGYTMPVIQGLVPNSPAAQSLKEKQFIIKVDGNSCKDKTLEVVVGMIRGAIGTHVTVTIADNKPGKKATDYNIVRAAVQLPADNGAGGMANFNAGCENEVKKLKKAGSEIIKTFSSECGNLYFNFEADKKLFHIRVITLEDKVAGASGPGLNAAAKVFDSDNEAAATELTPQDAKGYNPGIGLLEGAITFKRECVGVVNVNIRGDVKKCVGMYVIVYK